MPKLSAVPNPKLHIYKAKRYLVKTAESNVCNFDTLSDIAEYYHLTLSKVHNIIKNNLETKVNIGEEELNITIEDSKAKFEIVFEDKSCKCCKSVKDIKELTGLSSKVINEIIKRDNPTTEEEQKPKEKKEKCTPETCNCLSGCELTSAKYNGDVDEEDE